MIPLAATRSGPTVIGNTSGPQEFKMKASGKAFKLFSTSLYTDKIAAIIRELSTNAVDAMIEAGRGSEPIEVWLPTELEPTLIIKDTGVGMSEEILRTVYSTVFESSKTNSNDFNGELGLGSKSPIFYTDTMTVNTVRDGIRTVAAVYLNEHSIPCIDIINTSETCDSSGTTIQLSVHSQDISSFQTKAVDIYRFFDVMPTIHNMDELIHQRLVSKRTNLQYAKQHSITLDNGVKYTYDVTTTNEWSKGVYIVQSGVCYPVEQKFLPDDVYINRLMSNDTNSDFLELFRRGDHYFFVPNGSVAYGPSREGLEYTPHTIGFIKDLLNATPDAQIKFFDNVVKDATTIDDLINSTKQWFKKTQFIGTYTERFPESQVLSEVESVFDSYSEIFKDMPEQLSVRIYSPRYIQSRRETLWINRKGYGLDHKFHIIVDLKQIGNMTWCRSSTLMVIHCDTSVNKGNLVGLLRSEPKYSSKDILFTDDVEQFRCFKQLASMPLGKTQEDNVTTVSELLAELNITKNDLKSKTPSGSRRYDISSVVRDVSNAPTDKPIAFVVHNLKDDEIKLVDSNGKFLHCVGWNRNSVCEGLLKLGVNCIVVKGVQRFRDYVRSGEYDKIKSRVILTDTLNGMVVDKVSNYIDELDIDVLTNSQLISSMTYNIRTSIGVYGTPNSASNVIRNPISDTLWLLSLTDRTIYSKKIDEIAKEVDSKVEEQRNKLPDYLFDEHKSSIFIQNLVNDHVEKLLKGETL